MRFQMSCETAAQIQQNLFADILCVVLALAAPQTESEGPSAAL